MKAKFIYENMRFERGVDPKEAMGLGMMAKIKKGYMEYENELEREFYGSFGKYTKDNALLWTALNGYLSYVKFLLKVGADVHARNDDALRFACSHKHQKVAQFLIISGANVDAIEGEPLFWAITNDDINLIEILIKNRANFNLKGPKEAFEEQTSFMREKILEIIEKYK